MTQQKHVKKKRLNKLPKTASAPPESRITACMSTSPSHNVPKVIKLLRTVKTPHSDLFRSTRTRDGTIVEVFSIYKGIINYHVTQELCAAVQRLIEHHFHRTIPVA
jgi:hypothetical protein